MVGKDNIGDGNDRTAVGPKQKEVEAPPEIAEFLNSQSYQAKLAEARKRRAAALAARKTPQPEAEERPAAVSEIAHSVTRPGGVRDLAPLFIVGMPIAAASFLLWSWIATGVIELMQRVPLATPLDEPNIAAAAEDQGGTEMGPRPEEVPSIATAAMLPASFPDHYRSEVKPRLPEPDLAAPASRGPPARPELPAGGFVVAAWRPGETAAGPVTQTASLSEAGLEEPMPGLALNIFAPSALSDEAVATRLSEVKATGVSMPEAKPVSMRISTTQVRFFHAKDARAARRLADAAGAELRDFTGYTPAPAGGTVELWLAGKPLASERRTTRRRTIFSQSPEQVAATFTAFMRSNWPLQNNRSNRR